MPPDLPAFQTDAFTGLAFWTSSCAECNFVIWRGPAELNRYQCAGSAWHSQYTRSASIDGCWQILPKDGGNRGIEPRMRIGTGFTGPLSHQTWRYPNILKACGCAEVFAGAAEPRFSAINPAAHDRTRTYIADLRRVTLIQLSYVVIAAPAEAGGLFLEFDIPVQEVARRLVQEVRREVPLRGDKLTHRWLECFRRGSPAARRCAFAGAARRRDTLPRCHASCGARQEMIEGGDRSGGAGWRNMADEVVAQEHVEPGEGNGLAVAISRSAITDGSRITVDGLRTTCRTRPRRR